MNIKERQIRNFYGFIMLLDNKIGLNNNPVMDYLELVRLSKRMTSIDTHACNGTKYTDEISYQVAMNKIHVKIIRILDKYNLFHYHQSDPRGVALYISDKEINATNYTNGMAIY